MVETVLTVLMVVVVGMIYIVGSLFSILVLGAWFGLWTFDLSVTRPDRDQERRKRKRSRWAEYRRSRSANTGFQGLDGSHERIDEP